jgi:hypothetical protein
MLAMAVFDALPIQPGWTIATVIAIIAAIGVPIAAAVWQWKPWAAQLATALVVGHAALMLVLVSTSSNLFFSDMSWAPDNGGDGKRMMLAATAGLVAQFVIWMNRFAHASNVGSRWYAMYADAAIGAFCGVAGLAFLAATHTIEIHKLTQSQAATAGFGGGALGLGLVSLVRLWLPLSEGKAAAAANTERAGGTCLYAGQEYSDGATISMPTNGLPVVKVCDGATGCWKVEQATEHEFASLGLR